MKENWNDLEFFKNNYSRLKRPSITIGKNSIFIFGKFLQEENIKLNLNFIRIYYSKNNHSIIFEFTNDEEDSTPLHYRRTALTIGAKNFIAHYKLDLQKIRGRYLVEQQDINDKPMWVLKLK